jgi:hypothetical protein
MGGGENRKRKRQEKLQQYGVDIPDIPNVPVQVIPLLVNALKVATKFFQHESSTAYNDDWQRAVGSVAPLRNQGLQGSALDNVLNRLKSTTNAGSEESQQQEQRRTKMNDAIQAFLQAVKRFVRDRGSHDSTPAPDSSHITIENNAIARSKEGGCRVHISADLACFTYLWELGQEHRRLAVRRAALNLIRHLLGKSSVCRRFFLQESNNLWNWLQMLSAGVQGFDKTKQRLWQKEGHYLLLHLLSENYDDLYPKLRVSEQYLRQACSFDALESLGQLDEYESANSIDMGSLRLLRDVALGHGEEEIRRVDKLILRAHKCMDVLVPRIGKSDVLTPITPHQSTGSHQSDDEADEDDIAWEDGWDDDDNAYAETGNGEDRGDSHALAVERTLETMESIGGLKGGGLELDFSAINPDPCLAERLSLPQATSELLVARERFSKLVGFLSDRHLPRIRAWLEGLSRADRLQFPSPQSSLVLMPPDKSQKRAELHQRLITLKEQVSSILESAARLGLNNGNKQNT